MTKQRINELIMMCDVAREVSHPDVHYKLKVPSHTLFYSELEELLRCKMTELERDEEVKTQLP